MTDAEMAEAVGLARAFDDANSNTMKMGHALTIARALIAATARAERAEAELAGQCETCDGEGIMYTGKEVYLGSGALTPDEEAVNCPECLGSTRGWVAQAIAGKVARVVEAIAAWHDKASNIDSSHGNSGQAFAHALSADHIRSHNWAPPEEDGDE